MELPGWAKQEELYAPSSDRDFFLSRSLLRVMRVVFRLQQQGRRSREGAAAGSFFFLGVLIVLIVSTRSHYFLLLALAGEMVSLCLQAGDAICLLLQRAVTAMLAALLILMPSCLLNWSPAIWLIPVKTFLTVLAMGLVLDRFSWHALTSGLRAYHVPDIFIVIMDMALKYIALLGEVSLQMLWALKLRSVGHGRTAHQAFFGVLGMVFLRAYAMSMDMYQAMACRGFTGEYPSSPSRWGKRDLMLVMAAGGLVAVYAVC